MKEESIAKVEARDRIIELVRGFKRNEADYLRPTYNETQARTDFITPLLAAFGWDVYNSSGHPAGLREVIEEATVEVREGSSKRPDYELRLARQRKLFVEAKKPSVAIDNNRDAAFQTRRYGYSASLPISILTNFHQLAVYDCTPVPAKNDAANVARILLIRYDEFETRFEELWPLLSKYSVYSGAFDQRFAIGVTRHGAEQFDDYFLRQVRSWRERLATDIHTNTPELNSQELTYAVQLFLSRIVFLRICEDRDIERYENLRNLPATNTFEALLAELRRADAFYNSGLFRLLDDEQLGIRISDNVLRDIIDELYYPQSPYTFAVVETEVLGEIYEQFLGEEITIIDGTVSIVYKPEVRESGGVVTTPRFIVDAIVSRTLKPAIEGKSPEELDGFTAADICCGSGIFLLSIYEFFLDHYLSWYLSNNPDDHIGSKIYAVGLNNWRLTYDTKRQILQSHVRGVDIDANAVEVAQFSLLLKLIENEKLEDIKEYVTLKRERALPDLSNQIKAGNSLVSRAEWLVAFGVPMQESLIHKINPFGWQNEFPEEMGIGGFDVIVGNPPYIRIQNMMNYSPEEATFYKRPKSPYTTAKQDNFDKYALFFERALSISRSDGRLGFITPNKFMTIQAGRTLRRLLTSTRSLQAIVHFGAKQVFGQAASNYTCIAILYRGGNTNVKIEHVNNLEAWRYGETGRESNLDAGSLNEEAWQFANNETRAVFSKIRESCQTTLGSVADIFVGLQTSADDVFIFESKSETSDHYILNWDGRDWPIEKGIVRPFLHDGKLTAYTQPEANALLIFPYEFVLIKDKTSARLIQPEEMALQYPNCLNYLNARRSQLERRKISGGKKNEQQFYQFGRSQSLVKFNGPKIILPALSKEPRYVYDDKNVMVTGGGNGPYYLVRQRGDHGVSDYFILAVLNHPISEAFVRTNTSLFRGGYYSHGKQFIIDLPLPIPTDIDGAAVDVLVKQLIEVRSSVSRARTRHEKILKERQAAELRLQLEERLTRLYGLSATDMEVIRAVPVPN
jgi:type I restriction-modification system DNA methylase subunit